MLVVATLRTFKLAILVLLIASSNVAFAQDYFSLFHEGAETKAHAGAGTISSRNAPANYYNPANLIEEKRGLSPYVSVDILTFKYTYEIEGYEPVGVDTSSPVPFFGVNWRSDSDISLAFSLLPIPSDGSEQKIEKLPTLKFASDSESKPVLMDVTNKGEGVSMRSSLGVAYKIMSGLGVGLSMTYSSSKGSTTAKTHDSDENLMIDKTESSTYRFILGIRASALKGTLNSGLAIHLPATTRSKGYTQYPALAGDEKAPKSGTGKGPMTIGLGGNGEFFGFFIPFAEVRYTNWASLREQKQDQVLEQAEVDYYNTTDIIIGSDFKLSEYKVTFAYGMYQSYIGDGVMQSEADDNRELIGMEFQNMSGVAHSNLALGFDMPLWSGRLQTGLMYISGERDVWNKARGYGHYELSIVSVTAATTFAL